MKIAIITAVFGGIDSVKPFPKQTIHENVYYDRYFITEQNSIHPLFNLDDRGKAKFYKCQPHKAFARKDGSATYDLFIWIDGKIEITSAHFLYNILKDIEGKQLVVAPHPARKCIYDEVKFISNGIHQGSHYLKSRYNYEVLQHEADFYHINNYPVNNGLYDCAVFAVRNNRLMNKVFDLWFDSCIRWSWYDQLSFCYHLWNEEIPFSVLSHKDFQYTKHLK